METRYLIVGASHAALSALQAIRMQDAEGSITMVTRDDALPYSPTVLPYVVSGRSHPSRVALQGDSWLAENKVDFIRGAAVTSVDAAARRASFSNGKQIGFEKLLLATGAAPALPPIPGLKDVKFHVLRSLDDAIGLHAALPRTKQAVVLGAGLVGMHAAENLAKAGAQVTVVEMQSRVLAAYFDADAAAIIETAFAAKGVKLMLGAKVTQVSPAGEAVRVGTDKGAALDADLLLVATGVTPVTGYLAGSGVAVDRGVLVDDAMRTSVEHIWAAGDVAQAKGFYDEAKILNGILPSAVEQGRIAGMAMSGDAALKPWPGGVPLNTYTFFGQQAVSVGSQDAGEVVRKEADAKHYLKIVMRDNRLTGIFGINAPFDPGVMWELILRRVDLSSVREAFIAEPQKTARAIMSRTWR
ncbi:MAG: NAD(P)/FAD-dependent oxidoreductase [Zoogloeaceae bacterium]|jgi:phenylglyoxylate dehydrogenase epsilon subunit|nr:NAD(P)/FAD-dependent oxidoreductase [Zoogloeaceae bacterium]